MKLAIVDEPQVSSTVEGDIELDSWVVTVRIKLTARCNEEEVTNTRLYRLTTPRALPKFEPGDELDSKDWPIQEEEEDE